MPIILTRIAAAIGIKGGIAIIAGIALLWCWIAWGRADKRAEDLAVQVRTAEAAIAVLQTDAALKEAAAIQRQADNQAVAVTEQEMRDAIKDVVDSAPDAASVRLGCERLRRAGTPADRLPASCGPTG